MHGFSECQLESSACGDTCSLWRTVLEKEPAALHFRALTNGSLVLAGPVGLGLLWVM